MGALNSFCSHRSNVRSQNKDAGFISLLYCSLGCFPWSCSKGFTAHPKLDKVLEINLVLVKADLVAQEEILDLVVDLEEDLLQEGLILDLQLMLQLVEDLVLLEDSAVVPEDLVVHSVLEDLVLAKAPMT